jgi:hypothetical protein
MTELFFKEYPHSTIFFKSEHGISPHREDGPAIVWKNGNKDWYLDGRIYTFEEWCELLNKTPKEIMLLKLKYS